MADDTETPSLSAARRIAHVAPLTTLLEKVHASHTALIIVDMQNDFCASDGSVANGGRDVSHVQEMAKRLPELIELARQAGVLVVFVRCAYSTDDNRYLSDVWLEQAARRQGSGYTLAPVCQEGTRGGDYYGDVRPAAGDMIVTKHRYSAFHGTDLEVILRSHGVRTVVLTGVSTHVCVETTAREAFVRDYYTVVVADGSAAYSQQEHETALKLIDRFFGEITTIDHLRPLWPLRNSGFRPKPRRPSIGKAPV
jgi:ureidoacrylate peracid hydrolase